MSAGLYPYHLGRQAGVIKPNVPDGLTLNRTTLPAELRQTIKTTEIDTLL
jgi:hypothetical protein